LTGASAWPFKPLRVNPCATYPLHGCGEAPRAACPSERLNARRAAVSAGRRVTIRGAPQHDSDDAKVNQRGRRRFIGLFTRAQTTMGGWHITVRLWTQTLSSSSFSSSCCSAEVDTTIAVDAAYKTSRLPRVGRRPDEVASCVLMAHQSARSYLMPCAP